MLADLLLWQQPAECQAEALQTASAAVPLVLQLPGLKALECRVPRQAETGPPFQEVVWREPL